MKNCKICGAKEFKNQKVLWKELCDEWNLLPHEIDYINEQQGTTCSSCGANLRTQALAEAIMNAVPIRGLFASGFYRGVFQDFVTTGTANKLHVLEINPAGQLDTYLKKLKNHILAEYPEYDMMKLDLPDNSFDLVVHSDTLEHIPDPLTAMRECRRILKPQGHCIFTIPIIVDRLSRSRIGLPPSYHGPQDAKLEDYTVFSEFGCDSWKLCMEAGFQSVAISAFKYPGALAFICTK